MLALSLTSSEKNARICLRWQPLLLIILFVSASLSSLIQPVEDHNLSSSTRSTGNSLITRTRIGHSCTDEDKAIISRSLRRIVGLSTRAQLGTRDYDRVAWSEQIFTDNFVNRLRPERRRRLRRLRTEIHARFAAIEWEARHSLPTRWRGLAGSVDIDCHHRWSEECPPGSLPWASRDDVIHLVRSTVPLLFFDWLLLLLGKLLLYLLHQQQLLKCI